MGMEYRLKFNCDDASIAIGLLERMPALRRSGQDECDFELRDENHRDGMPEASMRVDSDGVYICVYGGSGDRYLGEVVARLVREFGAVTVTELE